MKETEFYTTSSKYFDCLADEYNFIKEYRRDGYGEFLSYSNDNYSIIVSYGPAEWKVAFSIELLNKDKEWDINKFSAFEICSIPEFENWFDNVGQRYEKGDSEILSSCKVFSALLRDFLDLLSVKGNVLFDIMHEKFMERHNKASYKERLDETRKHADEAWENKDYKQVIDSYTSILDELNKLEIKRLEYSKKQFKK